MSEAAPPAPTLLPGQVVVVTGLSGAGRSTAADELEDLGFYVVDNLPPRLLPLVVAHIEEAWGVEQPIAVVIDVRSGTFFDDLVDVVAQNRLGRPTSLLYLEADDQVLVRRQDAARRPHPLQGSGRLLEGLDREREVMGPVRAQADLVIDSSNLNVHELGAKVADAFGTHETTKMKATVLSFGFKHGMPVDADFVADMRFLPNPHWIPDLRPKTGRDADVADYVLHQPGAAEFLDRYVPMLIDVSAGYLREGKRFMTVAIGCTGGKHRSVAMTEEIAKRLNAAGVSAQAQHRDAEKE